MLVKKRSGSGSESHTDQKRDGSKRNKHSKKHQEKKEELEKESKPIIMKFHRTKETGWKIVKN